MAIAFPYLDIVNQLRLLWLVCGIAATLLTFLFPTTGGVRLALVAATAIHALLAALPIAFQPPSAPVSLTVTSFNVWVGNRTPEAVVSFLEGLNSDVLVLQEVDARLEAAIVPALARKFPHVVSCATRNCGLVLLSKLPWMDAGSTDRSGTNPAMIWAKYAGVNGSYKLVGLHLAWPFQPLFQTAQIKFLEQLAATEEPLILVGDFNLSPFTWKLNKLLFQTGLQRHALFGATWPAHRYVPVVLLDNLLASRHFGRGRIEVGPASGSDHRPITFDLGWK